MKIAVASDDQRTIASHFGRTLGFLIYEVEDGKVKAREYIPNTFTGHARGLEDADHSADRHGPIVVALEDCEAVISLGMGRRIYDDLISNGITPFIVMETDADRAVELFLQKGLEDHPDKGCDHT